MALVYIVRCRVEGGRTGTRESTLKANGVERVFSSFEEAQAVATAMDRAFGQRMFAVTCFTYWVEEAVR